MLIAIVGWTVVGKDDRRPHQYMKNRGMPKKGGAGGKGTWGTPGDELLDDYIDPSTERRVCRRCDSV